MAALPNTRIWTWEDALALPGGERYEVINGELIERTMSFGSSWLASKLIGLLWQWVHAGHPGAVTGADGGFTIFPWTAGDVRMPDVAFISAARLPRVPSSGWVSVPPELAVEVVSPNDVLTSAEDKARDYIRAGVDLVWVVYPPTRSVQVWRKDGSRAVVQAGGTLSGEDALPGFQVPLDDLFSGLAEAS